MDQSPRLPTPLIVVVRLSPSFGDLWRQMITGIDAELRVLAPGDVAGLPRVSAVLVAAGGAEREAMDWLEGRDHSKEVPVFVVGADTGRRTAAQVVAHGATDYFALPDDAEQLQNALVAAVSRYRNAVDPASPPTKLDVQAFQRIAGDSPGLRAVITRAARLARHAHGTALIIGETGTGKELLARAIHDGGPRRTAAFVPVNCSALPQQLVESELFGHEKGAFTDAHASKPGLFEVAEGGTLFLDEVGTLPVEMQAKLLRVLDDGEVRRVGATRSRRIDVRVIAATNEDLAGAIERGAFRRDLYFRLGVVTLELPALRFRSDDVVMVAERLLAALASVHDLPVPPLGADARKALKEYAWPGNVRELKNALERALLLSPRGTLTVAELLPSGSAIGWGNSQLLAAGQLDAMTAAAARATLEACGGNVSEAARRLKISRARLRRLLQAARTVTPRASVGTN